MTTRPIASDEWAKRPSKASPGRLVLFWSCIKVKAIKDEIINTVLPYIENADDLVYSKFLTPKDLNETFSFPKGNIDHITLTGKQNYNKRTFSNNPNNFYSYFDFHDVYYCGAGSFPCGSVAGTAGYMCSKQLIRNDR